MLSFGDQGRSPVAVFLENADSLASIVREAEANLATADTALREGLQSTRWYDGFSAAKGDRVVDNELLLILARLQDLYGERTVSPPWERPPPSIGTRASGARTPAPGSSLRSIIELYCGSFTPEGASVWKGLDEVTIKKPFLSELGNLSTNRGDIESLVDVLNAARADSDLMPPVADDEGVSPLSADILRATWTQDLYLVGRRYNNRLKDPVTWVAMGRYLSTHHALPALLRAARDAALALQEALKRQEKLMAPLNAEPNFLRAMHEARHLEAPLRLGGVNWRYSPLDPAAALQRAQLSCCSAIRDANCCWVVEGALAGTLEDRALFMNCATGEVLALCIAGSAVPPSEVAELVLETFEEAEQATLRLACAAAAPEAMEGGGEKVAPPTQSPQQCADHFVVSWQHLLLLLEKVPALRLCSGCAATFSERWFEKIMLRAVPFDESRRRIVEKDLGYAPFGWVVALVPLARPEDAASSCGAFGCYCACDCHAVATTATIGQRDAHAKYARAAQWCPDGCATCKPGAGIYHVRRLDGVGLAPTSKLHEPLPGTGDQRVHSSRCRVLVRGGGAQRVCTPCAAMLKNVASPARQKEREAAAASAAEEATGGGAPPAAAAADTEAMEDTAAADTEAMEGTSPLPQEPSPPLQNPEAVFKGSWKDYASTDDLRAGFEVLLATVAKLRAEKADLEKEIAGLREAAAAEGVFTFKDAEWKRALVVGDSAESKFLCSLFAAPQLLPWLKEKLSLPPHTAEMLHRTLKLAATRSPNGKHGNHHDPLLMNMAVALRMVAGPGYPALIQQWGLTLPSVDAINKRVRGFRSAGGFDPAKALLGQVVRWGQAPPSVLLPPPTKKKELVVVMMDGIQICANLKYSHALKRVDGFAFVPPWLAEAMRKEEEAAARAKKEARANKKIKVRAEAGAGNGAEPSPAEPYVSPLKGALATEAVVVMVRKADGFQTREVASYPLATVSGLTMAELLEEVLHELAWRGDTVVAVAWDGGSGNRALAQDLAAYVQVPPPPPRGKQYYDEATRDIPCWFTNPSTGERCYLVYDPEHVLKRLRNSLWSSGRPTRSGGTSKALMWEGQECVWTHIHEAMQLDHKLNKGGTFTFLNSESVALDAARVMRVDLATRVVNPWTIRWLRRIGMHTYVAPKVEVVAGGEGGGGGGGGGAVSTGVGAGGGAFSGTSTGKTEEGVWRNKYRGTYHYLQHVLNIFEGSYQRKFLTSWRDDKVIESAFNSALALRAWYDKDPEHAPFKGVVDDALLTVAATCGVVDTFFNPAKGYTGPGLWGRALSTNKLEHHFGDMRGGRGYGCYCGPTLDYAALISRAAFVAAGRTTSTTAAKDLVRAKRNVASELEKRFEKGMSEAEKDLVTKTLETVRDMEMQLCADAVDAYLTTAKYDGVRVSVFRFVRIDGAQKKVVLDFPRSLTAPVPWGFTGASLAALSLDPASTITAPARLNKAGTGVRGHPGVLKAFNTLMDLRDPECPVSVELPGAMVMEVLVLRNVPRGSNSAPPPGFVEPSLLATRLTSRLLVLGSQASLYRSLLSDGGGLGARIFSKMLADEEVRAYAKVIVDAAESHGGAVSTEDLSYELHHMWASWYVQSQMNTVFQTTLKTELDKMRQLGSLKAKAALRTQLAVERAVKKEKMAWVAGALPPPPSDGGAGRKRARE